MMETLRNATKSWFVRGLLLVIASTFALYFGSGGSMFSSLANRPVATVGKIEISQVEFAEAYRLRYLDLGGQLTPDQARQFGLPYSVLSELVAGALVDNAARDLGIAVSDAVLAADIRAQVGDVTPSMYQSMLRQQGFTVASFEKMLRRDLERSQLSAALAPQAVIPKVMADTLYKYREQKRIVEWVVVPAAGTDAVAPPDDAALQAYYDANTRRYTAPEYREVAYVALTRADVTDTVRVTDDAIAAEYRSRTAEFTTPDLRGLSQLFFPNEEEAIAARKRIDAGVPFADATRADAVPPANPAAAAGALQLGVGGLAFADNTSIGVLRREDLDPAIADAVFTLPEGGISQPLKSAFGWHIYRVNSVQQGGTKTLDEVREQLRADLGHDLALTELYRLSVTLDDALAGGASIEEAAQKVGLKANRETIDNLGRNRAGDKVATLPPFAQFVPTAFRTERGRESLLIDAPEGGYFVVRVDNILAPAPLPLDEIKERVRGDWIAEERAKRTQAVAQEFLDKAKAGGDFAKAAADAGYELHETPGFTRAGTGLDAANNLSPQLIGQMFTANVGDYAMSPSVSGGYAIGRLKEVVAVDPAVAEEAVTAIRNSVARDMANDVLSSYQTALRDKYGIAINDRALEQALNNATQTLPQTPVKR